MATSRSRKPPARSPGSSAGRSRSDGAKARRKSKAGDAAALAAEKPGIDASCIAIRGARQNNLQGIDLDIPLGRLTVVTGPSGSGKSSLAFQTLYAEGQRRYVETFSPYTRQFFDRMDKPAVDAIHGIPPAIAIEQVNQIRTTRSTVGTVTEINDYLKLLFPRLAEGRDPESGELVRPETPQSIVARAMELFGGRPVLVTFGVPVPAGTVPGEFFAFLQTQGYLRVLVFGEVHRTDEPEGYRRARLPAVVSVIQDRVRADESQRARLFEAVEAALRLGKGETTLVPAPEPSEGGTEAPAARTFSNSWDPLRPPTPGLFSFNSPVGACPECRGFGKTIGIDYERAVPDRTLTLAEGAVKAFQGETYSECQDDLERCCRTRGVDLDTPFDELPEDDQRWVFEGDHDDPEEAWRHGDWYGIRGFFQWMESKAYKMHVRVFLSRFRSYTTCPKCRGSRLKKEALHFRVGGHTLAEIWKMPVSRLAPLLESLEAPAGDHATELVLREITSRLRYLEDVGLGYLDLDRESRTLSGGEIQRVNLTTCLGASLTNTLFVLDEPSIGLHPRDTGRLIRVMEGLRDKGNTLVVVEHEEAVIRAADELVDIGPGRGEHGGLLVYQGPPPEGAAPSAGTHGPSLTLDYLSGRRAIPVPPKRRKPVPRGRSLRVLRAGQHNLRNIDVEIPLGRFVCVTGVSGSGKSTLVHHVLYENLVRRRGGRTENEPGRCRDVIGHDRVAEIVLVDQSPLARTPRSTPAVFTGAFDLVRKWFADSDDARSLGFTAGDFSFNAGNGRCERCGGTGHEKVEMQFLSDLYVICPECAGRRFRKPLLEVKVGGRSIADVLDLTVTGAIAFFGELDAAGAGDRSKPPARKAKRPAPARSAGARIVERLQPLDDVGLGYLRLGQPLNTLSGGEAQRLKLVGHLLESGPSSGKARDTRRGAAEPRHLLIFDEPTTGLHFDDIRLLVEVFQRLVDEGHTVLVIEHNLDVIKCADHVIDLGPEGGDRGGQVVATGTPEEIAACPESWTGRFLAPLLATDRQGRKDASGIIRYQAPEKEDRPSLARVAEEPPGTRPAANGSAIHIAGAREHNLKNLTLDIPRDEFVVVTGLSGSGKSTLAFDIVFAEGQRRFLDSMSPYARQFVTQMEKPDVDSISGLPPTVAIEQRVSQGGGKSTVATVTEVWQFLRLLWSKVGTQFCPDSGVPVVSQTVAEIADAVGAELAPGHPKRAAAKKPRRVMLLAPLVKGRKGFHTEVAAWAARRGYTHLLVDRQFREVEGFQRLERFREHDIDVVVAELGPEATPAEIRAAVEEALGVGKGSLRLLDTANRFRVLSTRMVSAATGRSFEDLDPRMFSYNSPHGWCPACRGYGVVGTSRRRRDLDVERFDSVLEAELDEEARMARTDEDDLETCPACEGSRLNRDARHVRVDGRRIEEIGRLAVRDARAAVESLTFATDRDALVARDIVPEITQRLRFMEEVGLGYLQLDRSARTLSGGEAQRIRLAAQLGSNLRGVLYVLDEPTIGLHPRDNARLLDTLSALREKGNSLLVVEHDEETIARATHLLDLGPGAGRFGGEIAYQGPPESLLATAPSRGGKDKIQTGKSRGRRRSTPDGTPGHHHAVTSPTALALADPIRHPSRGARRPLPKPKARAGWLRLAGARANNLQDLDVAIPLGRLTVVTGISGSGKSSLIRATLEPAVREALAALKKRKRSSKTPAATTTAAVTLPASVPAKSIRGVDGISAVYEVDQSPIGKTSRSCPATYVKVFDEIRKLFAATPTARMRGFDASRFSFNTEGGRCETCRGNGAIKLEMTFLPTTWVPCEDCGGLRYNAATLEIEYHGKHIGDVMRMSIAEATEFFESNPKIHRTLQLLVDTGTGYLQLGQPSPTLSGGEAQRIKLVTELTRGQGRAQNAKLRRADFTHRNLYLIEEPTIGLHTSDVRRLLDVLHRLVDEGHTVVVIEHNLDVIAEADLLLDIGPEAGAEGGRLVATGTPEEVATSPDSRTAPFLRNLLKNND